MKRRILVSILSAVCFLTAVIIMLYPAISNYVNQKYASEIHTAYVEQLRQADGTELRLIKDLANAFNKFYHETKILSEENEEQKSSYIALLVLCKRIMETCIDILGFEAPERM